MAGGKERYEWYAAHGICVVCGQRDALPKRKNALNAPKKRHWTILSNAALRENAAIIQEENKRGKNGFLLVYALSAGKRRNMDNYAMNAT